LRTCRFATRPTSLAKAVQSREFHSPLLRFIPLP
jgi:hypothetical protein